MIVAKIIFEPEPDVQFLMSGPSVYACVVSIAQF